MLVKQTGALVLAAMVVLFQLAGCGNTSGGVAVKPNPGSSSISAPTNLSVTRNGDGSYTITWTEVTGATTYTVYYSQSDQVSTSSYENKVDSTTASASVSGLASAVYYFIVTASTSTATSAASTALSYDNSACVPAHTWSGKTAIWTYTSCDKESTKVLWRTRTGENGQAIGTTSPNIGKLSFKQTNIDNSPFQEEKDYFYVFFYGFASEAAKQENNWHIHSYPVGGGSIQTRLTTQLIGGCGDFCERKTIDGSLQYNTGTSTVYQWDCEWNGVEQYASCSVKREGGSTIRSWTTGTDGGYETLNYLGVGKGAYQGPGYPQPDMTIYDMRVTLFN